MAKKAAFVAIIGRPSVGKSTLLNKICGEKVSIVSAVPQTTRNAIRGIVNKEQGQLVFIDTPGRYQSQKKANKKLLDISAKAIDESDIVLYVLDIARPPGQEDEDIATLLAPHAGKTVAIVNKIDSLQDADAQTVVDSNIVHNHAYYRKICEFLSQYLPALQENRLLPVSGKTGEGTEALLSALYELAPEGDPFYGDEYYTDQEAEFRIAEIIREQAIIRLREELPHALRIEVTDAQFSEAGMQSDTATPEAHDKNKLWVRAFIVVERESQIGIVVGKGGTMIKAIRLASLKELRKIFDWKIELDLRVKTGKVDRI
jgi:GTP-binding protein Era